MFTSCFVVFKQQNKHVSNDAMNSFRHVPQVGNYWKTFWHQSLVHLIKRLVSPNRLENRRGPRDFPGEQIRIAVAVILNWMELKEWRAFHVFTADILLVSAEVQADKSRRSCLIGRDDTPDICSMWEAWSLRCAFQPEWQTDTDLSHTQRPVII